MYYIQDVADVLLTRKSDGFKIATGTAQSTSISQSVDEDQIKGGIGNRTLYTIKSNKELEIEVKDAVFNPQWLAAIQGVKVENDQTLKVEMVETVEIGAQGKITIQDSKFTGKGVFVDSKGDNHEADIKSGVVTIDKVKDQAGKEGQIVYEKERKGKSISIRADRFAEKYKAQLNTIIYEAETEAIVEDLFVVFHNVTPSAEFELGIEAGEALAPEIKLVASADPKTKEIGNWFMSPHEEGKKD
ncbi:hypothetical protein ACFDHY_07015 [Staphylococcus hyicus]|uniref:hemoblobin-interacting domain-containing protein n=1 Tax=Staphylococcus hyicus TaxID=1284 RepID=UPI00211C3391|nr:hypothetical protein [Staphylococcus hyicus]MCQ9301348.1 hypothetical protein [Staphylococcus hyicus]MDP4448368.1 hypothetical protein [Staphylococcus hyicus]MDP4459715.1 hypothetical protein [Staphylococcus hyicus]